LRRADSQAALPKTSFGHPCRFEVLVCTVTLSAHSVALTNVAGQSSHVVAVAENLSSIVTPAATVFIVQ
jgi:hypothetical protein